MNGNGTSGRVRFAISIPQFCPDGEFDPAGFRTTMARAEALGFESAWALEQILGTKPTLAPLEAMTYAAACTERLRLGCAVFVTPLHNPVHLAKGLSTLDQLSRGRLEVGVGTGGKVRPFAAFGVEPSRLVARFTEGIRLMKALWTEQDIDFDGRFWQLDAGAMEPKPFQKPHPPLWIGGSHPDALRRSVRYGDGFFGAGSTTTAQFAQQVPVVRDALAEAGRDPGTFRIAKRLYVVVDDDAERARQRADAAMVDIYGDFGRSLGPVVVSGPPEACAAGVREVTAAGAGLVLFTPFSDQTEQMERLAAEVIPKVG
jgi:probable F420-dependent oxidoreductase